MDLTLKNLEVVLSKELIQQAKKNTVRECDETEKGHFVAYVDEGSDSYDVSVIISNNTVSKHSCDCKAGKSFCRHKAALLIHIAGNKKAKSTTIKAKKKSKAEALLDEADAADLKEWLRELITKNKDIELSFTHYFTAKNQQYTPEEVSAITNDAIKAVAGNKKNIDPTQLKKIVDLWTNIHQPVVRNYQENTADKKLFVNFHAMLEACNAFLFKINTSSNKIVKYVEGLLLQIVETINNIYNDEAWSNATGYFIDYLITEGNEVRLHYLLHLKNIAEISDANRKQKLIESLVDHYKQHKKKNLYNESLYTKILFGMIEECGLFSLYYHLFQPITWDNDFNTRLIALLIKSNQLQLAETYCRKQIQGNYNEEYNVPYWEQLKEIYTIQKNEDKLADVLKDLLPRTFDFDDYLFIYNRMPEGEEKKKWRSKILTKAKNASGSSRGKGTQFYFGILDHEQNYKKMIDTIDSYTPYSVILKYFDPMVKTDKTRLLNALMENTGHSYWLEDETKNENYFPELYTSVLKYFSADALMEIIKRIESKGFYYRPNPFMQFIKKKLLF